MYERRAHWENVYRTKEETAVSWYQERPERSLDLIRRAAPDEAAPILDVGGGASRLVDALLAEGRSDVTVLDLSEAALARSRARLGPEADRVGWIAADVTRWQPERRWAVWHDRAVFHFLTEKADQDAYLATLRAATEPGSAIVIATFAPEGPERCSGLPVERYSAETLAARFGAEFRLEAQAAERHVTPGGSVQAFAYAVLRRG
ncbi:class I SAM-dependent methyltransferase [Faunimonas sp. B44]|uniref:class I SAM-dependent methyltransferase n=1 Tax=Faunimonas sp. B44 TaxID=3461493 RepID=UPI0040449922